MDRKEHYSTWYRQSIEDPSAFWDARAKDYLSCFQPWQKVCYWDYTTADIRWFEGAKLNVAYHCLDRHLNKNPHKTALIFERDEPGQSESITYQTLYEKTCQLANALVQLGIRKGDRVCIYLPMIPEAVIAMLAVARIGAVHSVVFGGFSSQALYERIKDSDCKLVITANEGMRGGKVVPLKANVDAALEMPTSVTQVLVIQNTKTHVPMNLLRDLHYHDVVNHQPKFHEPLHLDAEDPLFILYTSGSTGKPKGVLHTQAGYLLYAAFTFDYVFDYQARDIFWCTADVGWITGHTYLVYGPLSQGATVVLFEGTPQYPNPSRFWQIVEQHRVTTLYTAPTAIRALMGQGDSYVTAHDRSSLRLLGSVGEPINPEAWQWYHQVVGEKRCPVLDTWWQTETGGILLAPFLGVAEQRSGCAGLPFFGVRPAVVDAAGHKVSPNVAGDLVLMQSWPGQMRTVFGNHKRFVKTYFKIHSGCYLSGDEAKQDQKGYITIVGRADDVMNISGHRIGTAEVESALAAYPCVTEAAVVSTPDALTGQAMIAYVVLTAGYDQEVDLELKLMQQVAEVIGKFAKPRKIYCVDALPKTRSGKIMRRLLRKIANHELEDLGDVSTLANPESVEELIDAVQNNNISSEA
jgi:acetyl-CoA synthetase